MQLNPGRLPGLKEDATALMVLVGTRNYLYRTKASFQNDLTA